MRWELLGQCCRSKFLVGSLCNAEAGFSIDNGKVRFNYYALTSLFIDLTVEPQYNRPHYTEPFGSLAMTHEHNTIDTIDSSREWAGLAALANYVVLTIMSIDTTCEGLAADIPLEFMQAQV